ncbi:MAG TPA: hypothetical protein PK876_06890 [Elusimicrobiota bacterium]|nr:hypothetical protein [Elusimicrobiota bacterium]
MHTIKTLLDKIKSLGLSPNGHKTKEQLEDFLRNYLWERQFPGQPMPSSLAPMKASSLSDLPEEEQEGIWASPLWPCGIKWDGVRCLLHMGDGPANSNRMTSRRKSDVHFRYHELQDNFPHIRDRRIPVLEGTVLDGELYSFVREVDTGSTITGSPLQVATALTICSPEKACQIQSKHSWLSLIVFDILFLRGEDLRLKPFSERRAILSDLFRSHSFGNYIRLEDLIYEDKKDFFLSHIEDGGEGVMLKDLRAPYTGEGRPPFWRKAKRQVTYDGFVSGWAPGREKGAFRKLVGSLEISAYEPSGKQVVIAHCTSLPYHTRCEISVPDGEDGVMLKPDVLGRVLEVQGYEWNKNGLITQARIVRWRPEKPRDDCFVESHSTRIASSNGKRRWFATELQEESEQHERPNEAQVHAPSAA